MFWNSIPEVLWSFLPLTLFFVLGRSIFVRLIFHAAVGSIFRRATAWTRAPGRDREVRARDPREMKGFHGWYARTLLLSRHTRPERWRAPWDRRAIGMLVRDHPAPAPSFL